MRFSPVVAIVGFLFSAAPVWAQGLPAPSAADGPQWAAVQPPVLPTAGPFDTFNRPVPLRVNAAPEQSRAMNLGMPQSLSRMPVSGPAYPMLIPPGLTQAAPLDQPITVLNAQQQGAADGQPLMPAINMSIAQLPENPPQRVPAIEMPAAPQFDQPYGGPIQQPMMNGQPYPAQMAPMGIDFDYANGLNGGMSGCDCGCETGGDWGQGAPGCGTGGALVPFAYGGIFAANNRVVSRTGAFLPFWQEQDSMLFLDFRGQWDDQDSGEANLGIGYRMFLDQWWIFGNYLYWDILSTNQDNVFHQGTLGFELLSLDWEGRLNITFPGSWDSPAKSASGLSNRTVVTRDFQERAYAGFDAEIGNRFMYWGWNDRFELRWYLGGYYYEQSAAGFPSFGGPRGRIEFRIHDLSWLGPQSRLVMGVEGSHDRLNDDQIAGFFRFQIPLGARQGRAVLDPLRRRFIDAPSRDVE